MTLDDERDEKPWDRPRAKPGERDAHVARSTSVVRCLDDKLPWDERVSPSWMCKVLGRVEACANCLPFIIEPSASEAKR